MVALHFKMSELHKVNKETKQQCVYLPGSKLGQAMGESSTLMNKVPSAGRTWLGSDS